MYTFSTLQAITWVVLFLVTFSVILQYFVYRSSHQKVSRLDRLVTQNKKLIETIMGLHKQIEVLNKDLEKLSRENDILKQEVRMLSSRVNSIQIQITAKDCEDDTRNN